MLAISYDPGFDFGLPNLSTTQLVLMVALADHEIDLREVAFYCDNCKKKFVYYSRKMLLNLCNLYLGSSITLVTLALTSSVDSVRKSIFSATPDFTDLYAFYNN